MEEDIVLKLAEQIGFSHLGPVCMEALLPLPQIRSLCSEDRCKRFDRCWSCPPSPVCASLDAMTEKIRSYSKGLLVQCTGNMADPFDMDVIRETEKRQKQLFDTLVRQTRKLGINCMPMGSGSCTRCYKCTYPDRPCRHPDQLYPSMEACGLWVSDVCEKSGLGYNYGGNTITYTACLLYR